MSENSEWRCFHCGELFTNFELAAQHFGRFELSEPACQIDIAKYREMEEELARWQAEGTDLHRTIAGLQSELSTAKRRAEEEGYARGLRDAEGFGAVYERVHTGTVGEAS